MLFRLSHRYTVFGYVLSSIAMSVWVIPVDSRAAVNAVPNVEGLGIVRREG
jgi:hypothetical protein